MLVQEDSVTSRQGKKEDTHINNIIITVAHSVIRSIKTISNISDLVVNDL